jgi:hypothetical protein
LNTFLKLAAVALVGTVAMAAPSSATTINGTCGFDTGLTERGTQAVPVSFTCTQFDSNLGPLTSMTLSITGQITGPLLLTNNAGQPQAFEFEVDYRFRVGALPGFSFNAAPSNTFIASFATGLINLPTAGTAPYNLNIAGGTGVMVNNSNFAPYQAPGGGNFTINYFTNTLTSFSGGGGNIAVDQTTEAFTTATVTYTYGVTTPEPASMALLGAGMLALGIARRRRRG